MSVLDELVELKQWVIGSDEIYLVHTLPPDIKVDFYSDRFEHFNSEALSIIFCIIQMEFDRTKILQLIESCIQETELTH